MPPPRGVREGRRRPAARPLRLAKDHFRKPSTGCWDYLVRTLPVGAAVDLSASFFVGDAAGRMGDHSDSDKAFAEAVGLPFFNEKAFFLERHPPAVS